MTNTTKITFDILDNVNNDDVLSENLESLITFNLLRYRRLGVQKIKLIKLLHYTNDLFEGRYNNYLNVGETEDIRDIIDDIRNMYSDEDIAIMIAEKLTPPVDFLNDFIFQPRKVIKTQREVIWCLPHIMEHIETNPINQLKIVSDTVVIKHPKSNINGNLLRMDI